MNELPQSMSELAKHAGLTHKLLRALDAACFDPRKLNQLAEEPEKLREIYGTMEGWAEIKPKEFEIDCSVEPSIEPLLLPEGGVIHNWELATHLKQGKKILTRVGEELYLNGKQISLYTIEIKEGMKITSAEIAEQLATKTALNINVRDFLLKHSWIIPEPWRRIGREADYPHGPRFRIHFWGTRIRHLHGERNLLIPCVQASYDQWYWVKDDSWVPSAYNLTFAVVE